MPRCKGGSNTGSEPRIELALGAILMTIVILLTVFFSK